MRNFPICMKSVLRIRMWTYTVFVVIFTLAWQVEGQCRGEADVVIAVPGSLPEVPSEEFAAFEQGLIDLVSYFSITPTDINVGLILYGKGAVNIASPQPYKTRTQINTRISLMQGRMLNMAKLIGGTDVAGAITAVHGMLLVEPPNGYSPMILRPEAQKIGVIFLYDNVTAEEVPNVIHAAQVAKDAGVLLYALQTGTTGEEFQAIGTDVCRLFSMGNFSTGLPSAMVYLGFGICAAADTRVTVTPGNCFPWQYSGAPRQAVTCHETNPGLIPDPDNCAYFYRCQYQDSNPERYMCALNTIYDPLVANCNHKENVACFADLKCPPEKGLYPHPLDCSSYLNCYDDRVPQVQVCPHGTKFDDSTGNCNSTEFVTCNNPLNI